MTAWVGPPLAWVEGNALPLLLLAFAVGTLLATLWLFRRTELRTSKSSSSVDAMPADAARAAARRYRQRGQLEEAARLFARAGELEEAATCREELKHYTEAAALYEASGAWIAAARCFRMAQRPHLAAPLFEKGGYFREAAQCFELDGQFSQAASCHYRAGQSEAAIDCLRRAGDPYRLACAFLLQGRMIEALEALERVTTRSEDYGKARLLLAKVLADQGQPQRALDALKDYLETAPSGDHRRHAHIYLAKLLELMERDDDALLELQRLREELPGDAVVERRWRRIKKRVELREQEPDSPQLRLRRITGIDMPSDLAPEIDDPVRAPVEPPGARRFRILERLGDSELALTYRAVRIEDGAAVVVKFFREQGGLRAERRQEFTVALRLTQRVSHPNILEQVETGELDGRLYAAYAFTPALTVERWIMERGQPAALARALALIGQVCDAVEVAHHAGILHRGIDPTTVLVSREGAALVDDLGVLAAFAAFDPDAAAAAASPYFAAPEIVAGGEASPASDVYAIGALLFYLLTTCPPFEQGALLSYWGRVDSPDPRSKNPDVPDAVAAVVRQSLEKNPEARPATPGALRDALRLATQARPAEAGRRR